jgi:16S rRNA (guanine966-N2)-methyltransferase
MRISGGAARGINLSVPRGGLVRPATDSLRQAVFSSLGARVAGSRFLDLFAGSGAYGLEALSRGAAGGSFVESSPRAVACLRTNLAAVCKCLGRGENDLFIRQGDALTVPLGGAGCPDLVFVDPPYESIGEAALPLFARLDLALETVPDALVVFEMPGEIALSPPGWTEIKRLGRGARQPTVGFYRRT